MDSTFEKNKEAEKPPNLEDIEAQEKKFSIKKQNLSTVEEGEDV